MIFTTIGDPVDPLPSRLRDIRLLGDELIDAIFAGSIFGKQITKEPARRHPFEAVVPEDEAPETQADFINQKLAEAAESDRQAEAKEEYPVCDICGQRHPLPADDWFIYPAEEDDTDAEDETYHFEADDDYEYALEGSGTVAIRPEGREDVSFVLRADKIEKLYVLSRVTKDEWVTLGKEYS